MRNVLDHIVLEGSDESVDNRTNMSSSSDQESGVVDDVALMVANVDV